MKEEAQDETEKGRSKQEEGDRRASVGFLEGESRHPLLSGGPRPGLSCDRGLVPQTLDQERLVHIPHPRSNSPGCRDSCRRRGDGCAVCHLPLSLSLSQTYTAVSQRLSDIITD